MKMICIIVTTVNKRLTAEVRVRATLGDKFSNSTEALHSPFNSSAIIKRSRFN